MKPSEGSISARSVTIAGPDPALALVDVVAGYGEVVALHGVNVSVPAGACVALIGSNGAGKTTLLKAVSGSLRLRSGDIKLFGVSTRSLSTPGIVRAGIAHAPEGRRLFLEMSVEENLLLGAFVEPDRRGKTNALLEKMYEQFPRVSERRKQIAGTMSGGEQQMVAICRALMSSPKILLLDEPTLGLSPIMVDHVAMMIGKIREEGTTIVLVEQNAKVALQLSDCAVVLEAGQVVLEGPSEEIEINPRVQAAYLGI